MPTFSFFFLLMKIHKLDDVEIMKRGTDWEL